MKIIDEILNQVGKEYEKSFIPNKAIFYCLLRKKQLKQFASEVSLDLSENILKRKGTLTYHTMFGDVRFIITKDVAEPIVVTKLHYEKESFNDKLIKQNLKERQENAENAWISSSPIKLKGVSASMNNPFDDPIFKTKEYQEFLIKMMEKVKPKLSEESFDNPIIFGTPEHPKECEHDFLVCTTGNKGLEFISKCRKCGFTKK